MHHTAVVFAAALALFWGVALTWAWHHPHRLAELEPLALDYRIDINAADSATLQLLPGVGPGIADNVIDLRDRGHRFHGPADLEDVHYIGPRTAERITPWLRFAPE